MWHIYRQISAVNRFQMQVFTRKRENAALMPYQGVVEVPRSSWLWLRRIIEQQLLRKPLLLSTGEAKSLHARLREHRCHLLHIVFGNTAVQLLPLLRLKGRRYPVLVSFHGADASIKIESPQIRELYSELLAKADLVLVRSQSLASSLIQMGCPQEKIRLNRTGVPCNEFVHRARQWPVDGAWKLLQACRLMEKKGLDTSLRAFAKFAEDHPQATFTIAGDGPDKQVLQELAQELGVASKVRFVGFLNQDELRICLYESHLFLHPSQIANDGDQEGIPNSLLEAMSTGLPSFTTRHGGIEEVVEHGINGFLVPERNHQLLAGALLAAASQPWRLDAISLAASNNVAENFSLKAQAKRLEEYYQEAIEEAWISADNNG